MLIYFNITNRYKFIDFITEIINYFIVNITNYFIAHNNVIIY
jgi:hypothetical protein